MNDLIDAYRATHYRVTDVDPPFVLTIGVHSAELRELHTQHRVSCSAFLTAWNPRSRPTGMADNRASQARMTAELRKSRYPLIDGIGESPDGGWSEDSLLVLGLDRATAATIGRRYGQIAIVWSGVDAVPELVLLDC